MSDATQTPRRQRREDRNRQLAEWTLGIIGIFWGVWWGFFVNEILASDRATAVFFGLLSASKTFFLVVSALYVGFLVFTLVRWMWALRTLSRLTRFWSLLMDLRRPAFVLGGFIAAVYVVSDTFGLGMDQATYGAVLSLLWPTVTYAVLLAADRT